MQEFIYFNNGALDFPLNEKIQVVTNEEDLEDNTYLISNSKSVKSEFLAPEIDFYIKNSKDSLALKITNVSALYEINATKFDFSQDISQTIEISNSLMIIYDDIEDYKNFIKNLKPNEFELYKVEAKLIKDIKNSIGNFEVIVNSNDKDIKLPTSQIVWFNQKLTKVKNGIFDPNILGIDSILEKIRENIDSFSFKKTLLYNKNICQYDDRKVKETCSKCEEVCPTNAITKDDKNKKLVFSYVDCLACGECVSVCPSGALNSAATSRESLYEISLFYKNRHPLIISSSIDLDSIDVSLKENVFPLVITGDIFDESILLTYLQVSSSQLIYFSQDISKGSKEAIKILNEIYEKKYSKKAIYLVENIQELEVALKEVEFVENSYFNFNQQELKKREIFAQRLQKLVGNQDLGIVKTGEYIHYGRVLVNEANCTLCLSCVGACNVDALFANEADFTLRVNPSVCTGCGYCEVVCPENDCLTIKQDELELSPVWFTESILAKDKLFACVECGKEFATTKAIEKIASIMGPIFAKQSETKKRTLYCCEDCKAKIMIKQGLLDA
ncbi:4Fe-4S binding protein [Aliarcobacter lanthieri]|uniref:4Fe-4S binding protein n=1 Tax=Aliarcobacter lanthieri TaxID=1355374 RepID=UPI003AAFD5B9